MGWNDFCGEKLGFAARVSQTRVALTVLMGSLGTEGTDCLLLKGFNLPFCYVGTSTPKRLPRLTSFLGQIHHQLPPS